MEKKKRFTISYDPESFEEAKEEAKELNKKFKTNGFKLKGKAVKTADGIKVVGKKGYDKDPN